MHTSHAMPFWHADLLGTHMSQRFLVYTHVTTACSPWHTHVTKCSCVLADNAMQYTTMPCNTIQFETYIWHAISSKRGTPTSRHSARAGWGSPSTGTFTCWQMTFCFRMSCFPWRSFYLPYLLPYDEAWYDPGILVLLSKQSMHGTTPILKHNNMAVCNAFLTCVNLWHFPAY